MANDVRDMAFDDTLPAGCASDATLPDGVEKRFIIYLEDVDEKDPSCSDDVSMFVGNAEHKHHSR